MTGSRKELPAGQRNIPDRFRETHMQLTGRVRETDGERIVLAGMSWSLHAFPVAAGVIISDDPARRLPEAYNVMPWPKKASITLAGPASNVILTAAVLVIIAVFPVTRVSAPVLTVQYVEPGGPAAQAGMLPGDRIIEVNNRLNPGAEEMREMTAAAALRGGILRVRALRQGEGSVYLRVRPRPETGRIGVLLDGPGNTGGKYRMTPLAVGQRVRDVGRSYLGAVGGLFQTPFREEPEDRLEAISGPVMGSLPVGAGGRVRRTPRDG